MPTPTMPAELAQIIATHKALFGGFVMQASEQQDGGESGATPPANDFQPITSQDELNRIIGDRVKRAKPADYDDLKAKAEKFDQLEAANKTEIEKATDRATALQSELDRLKSDLAAKDLDLLRERVANSKGVPAHRITGTTEAELKADADKYLAETKGRYVVPSQGTGSPNPGLSDGRERALAYLKNKKT